MTVNGVRSSCGSTRQVLSGPDGLLELLDESALELQAPDLSQGRGCEGSERRGQLQLLGGERGTGVLHHDQGTGRLVLVGRQVDDDLGAVERHGALVATLQSVAQAIDVVQVTGRGGDGPRAGLASPRQCHPDGAQQALCRRHDLGHGVLVGGGLVHQEGEPLQLPVPPCQVVLSMGARDDGGQVLEVVGRLRDVVDRPEPQRLDHQHLRPRPGDHDGGRRVRHPHDGAQQVGPRHQRQLLVDQHDVRDPELVDGLLTRTGGADLVPGRTEGPHDQHAMVGTVLHDQDVRRTAHDRAGRHADRGRGAHAGGSGRAASDPQ